MQLFRKTASPANVIDVDPSFQPRLTIEGTDNYLRIDKPHTAGNVEIQITGGASVSIEGGCVLGHLFIYATAGSRVEIGEGVAFNGLIRLLLHEPRTIRIGAGSLFGGNTDITVSDMHSILDADTGARINQAKDVFISPRVWVGQSALILKGASIGADSVIGAGSIVTGAIPANCIAAGNPARVVRRNVRWCHELIDSHTRPTQRNGR